MFSNALLCRQEKQGKESCNSEAGTGHLEAGTGHLETGSGNLEFGLWHLEAGTDHPKADSDHPEAGSGHLEAGPGHLEAGSGHQEASLGFCRGHKGHEEEGEEEEVSSELIFSSAMTEEDPNGNAEMCQEGNDNYRWKSQTYFKNITHSFLFYVGYCLNIFA